MAVSSDMYQRGMAQRAGAQGGFDPYSTVGWDKRKPDWDTNWQQWEVNREYAGDDGRQVRGRFSSPSAGYSDMLSGTMTGPSGGRAGGSVNVALNNNFGRGTATNPAAEIGHLNRAVSTTSGLFDGIGEAVQDVVKYSRNLSRVKAQRNAVQSGMNRQTAPGAPSQKPVTAPNFPNLNRPPGDENRDSLSLNQVKGLQEAASWSDAQVNAGGGYGAVARSGLRDTARESLATGAFNRKVSAPTSNPAPFIGPPAPKGPIMSSSPQYYEKAADTPVKDKPLSKAGKAAVEKALGKGAPQGVVFPPVVDTNDAGSANAANKGGSRNTTRGTRKKTQEGTSNGS